MDRLVRFSIARRTFASSVTLAHVKLKRTTGRDVSHRTALGYILGLLTHPRAISGWGAKGVASVPVKDLPRSSEDRLKGDDRIEAGSVCYTALYGVDFGDEYVNDL